MIDSTGVIELIVFVQERFAISVDDEEVTSDNLGSVKSIVAFIEKKLQSKGRLPTAGARGLGALRTGYSETAAVHPARSGGYLVTVILRKRWSDREFWPAGLHVIKAKGLTDATATEFRDFPSSLCGKT